MVWIAFASMIAAAVLCVVWPLVRRPSTEPVEPLPDVGFYRQQIAELDDDVARGMLAAGEASDTRAELGRRLLAAADRPDRYRGFGASRGRLVAAVLATAVLPAVSLGLYLKIGSPRYTDLPLASRDMPQQDIMALLDRVETHLATHPDDYRGYELIAPVYVRMGRYGDAARAYEAMIRIKGDAPQRDVDYGQALMMAADGVITAAARSAFETALKLDPAMPQARFFTGVAAEQDGDRAKARAVWQKLVDEAPADAPWLEPVRRRIAALDGGPPSPAPPPAEVAAAEPSAGGDGTPSAAMQGAPTGPMAASIAALPADQRQAAIRGMVDGLAARLAQNGHDPDGWLRLVRAYTVLGEADKARRALADARRAMAGDGSTLGRLDGLAHELGLEG